MKRIRPFILAGLSSLSASFLGGCGQMLLLTPKGPVGLTERFVIVTAFVLMLIVVVPVIVMAFWFPLKYRAANTRAPYMPKWSHSGKIDLVVWLVPAAIVAALGTLAWITTHQLDPYRPIDPEVKPISIDAVAMDWKWLFIYPEQQIATVNQIVFPANVPLSFRITSDTVMSSFFIPQLGSQIYAMPGNLSRLYLKANVPGVFAGQNQQFSGSGYAGMHFEAIATSPEAFAAWVQKARQSPERLDSARLSALRRPSENSPVQLYSGVDPDLLVRIIQAHMPAMAMEQDDGKRKSAAEAGETGASEVR
jgi:cytochrome o ubiquinol oxidase subunit 2